VDWALSWPWLALALLGAYHGINPGMGWLFAVNRGLQERSRRAVLKSLVPIVIGHEASIAVVVGTVVIAEAYLVPHTVRLLAALGLAAVGLYKIAKPRSHPRGFGMRVGLLGLAAWSFLMSSAHGAGLMLAPVLLGLPVADRYEDIRQLSWLALGAATVHVLAMLLVMGGVAIAVYEWLGLRLLKRAWFNLDLAWAVSLIAAGLITLFT
jgi:hypothetical protein